MSTKVSKSTTKCFEDFLEQLYTQHAFQTRSVADFGWYSERELTSNRFPCCMLMHVLWDVLNLLEITRYTGKKDLNLKLELATKFSDPEDIANYRSAIEFADNLV